VQNGQSRSEGAVDVALAVSPLRLVELTVTGGDVRAAIASGAQANIVASASIGHLESMEQHHNDPNALQVRFTGGLGTRVYRMGAAKVLQVMHLLQTRLIESFVAQSGVMTQMMQNPLNSQQAGASPGSLPRALLCALDFDQTVTRKDSVKNLRNIDLSSLIGSHRITLVQNLCTLLAKSGVVLIVLSFNVRKVIVPVLQKLGVLSLFQNIYDQNDIAPFQSKQNFMGHLMHKKSIRPENCVLVDDHVGNLQGAPCKTVLVRERKGIGALEVREIFSSLRLLPRAGAGREESGREESGREESHLAKLSSEQSQVNDTVFSLFQQHSKGTDRMQDFQHQQQHRHQQQHQQQQQQRENDFVLLQQLQEHRHEARSEVERKLQQFKLSNHDKPFHDKPFALYVHQQSMHRQAMHASQYQHAMHATPRSTRQISVPPPDMDTNLMSRSDVTSLRTLPSPRTLPRMAPLVSVGSLSQPPLHGRLSPLGGLGKGTGFIN